MTRAPHEITTSELADVTGGSAWSFATRCGAVALAAGTATGYRQTKTRFGKKEGAIFGALYGVGAGAVACMALGHYNGDWNGEPSSQEQL